jgi:hypothetical protein
MTEVLKREDFMEDSRGRMVPISMVDEIDQQRDSLVRELVDGARALQASMRQFKNRAMGDVQAFVDLSAERYEVRLGGQKGNVSLVSFNGRYKVQVAISEHLAFDERLKAAKVLIDQCLTGWTADSRDEIKTIVLDAFQVDQEGRLNTARILGLRRLPIEDARWMRAMAAIADSMQVVGSKSYFRVYERSGPDSRWNAIALDLASL